MIPMRFIVMTVFVALAAGACKDTPIARNLAWDSISDLDPELAKNCSPHYTEAGPNLTSSVRCKLPDKTWALCEIELHTNLTCKPLLNQPPPKDAPAATSSTTPTPAPPFSPPRTP